MTTYSAASSAPHAPFRDYGQRWRSVPRELGFLLPSLPIALVSFAITISLFAVGVSLIVVWIGVPVTLAAMYCARGFGEFELRRLQVAGAPPLARPDWARGVRPGFIGQVRTVLLSAPYWRHLLHTVVVGFAVSLFSWCVAVVWAVSGLGGITHWFWARFIPVEGEQFWLHNQILGFAIPGYSPATNYDELFAAEGALYAVLGVIMLITLPWVTNGLVALHQGAARLLLSESTHEVLVRENVDLAASRGSAVIAEDHSLRRLERDIHDGPQQRLIRLQFDISSAERKMESDPVAARALMAGALQQSKDTLDELRSLSRGFAPPILQDRGLVAAVESLAGRSAVPVTVSLVVEPSTGLTVVERSAYFVVAELLTNVDKHANATAASVGITVERVSPGSSVLVITVTDLGDGGAAITPGHGLAGLHERVLGLRGTLDIASPKGGPTLVTVRIPFNGAGADV
jgi:signal transduction histidine kinase